MSSSMYYRLDIVVKNHTLPYGSIAYRPNDNAGYDCYCANSMRIPKTGTPVLIPLGIQARMVRVNEATGEEVDAHYWLAPRSSIFKKGLSMANSMGVIDRSYRGELKAPAFLHHTLEGDDAVHFPDWGVVNQGERLFQIVAPDMGWIREVRVVDSLPDTVRGEGGFGSSGR